MSEPLSVAWVCQPQYCVRNPLEAVMPVAVRTK